MRYDNKGVQEYIIPECDAVDRFIPYKKHIWLIGITRAPKNINFSLSLGSILKFNFLNLKTINNNIVAIPNLIKANIIGWISFTTNFAAMGVNDVENVRKRIIDNFFIVSEGKG